MANEPLGNMQKVWQEQPLLSAAPSVDELQRHALALAATIRRRNVREYTAATVIVVVFAYYLWVFRTPIMQAGSLLSIVGAVIVIHQLRRRSSARNPAADLALNTCLEFYRRELVRQRDLLNKAWSWYVLPLVPGLGLFLAGLAIEPLHGRWWPVALVGALCAIAFGLVVKVNRSAACALDRHIARVMENAKEE